MFDAGEGIPSITVTLVGDFDGDGSDETVTTSTDADGHYLFSGLRTTSVGVAYLVTVDTADSQFPVGLTVNHVDPDTASPGDNKSTISLKTAAPSNLVQDFGYRGIGQIGDTVFADINNNGVFDAGEGIPNITVTLVGDADGDGSDETVTTSTDANGNYLFSGLRTTLGGVGYVVTVDIADPQFPVGLTVNHVDPDTASPGDSKSTVSLSDSAASNLLQDFGYRGIGQIGDTVFADWNGNGTPDAGEGITNITVTLVGDFDGDGLNETVTTSTDIDGKYLFSGLRTTTGAGVSYTVTVDTADPQFPVGLTVNTVDPYGLKDSSSVVSLTDAASTNDLQDFGYRGTGSIAGQVRNDTDGNGVLTDPDAGLPGAQIKLFLDPVGAGNPADFIQIDATITTDATGNYQFIGLPPGNYVVVEINPFEYGSTGDKTAPNDDRIPLTLATGETSTGNDFLDAHFGKIAGTVKADIDNNGSGDVPLAGVTVTLFTDPNGDGNPSDGVPFGAPVVTQPDGSYLFENVPTGSYVVVETDPAGYQSESDGDSTPDAVFSPPDAPNTNINDNWLPVNLVAGETDSGNDFVDVGIYVLGDRVWLDEDGDGVQDAGEAGIANVVVQLYDTTGTILLATTVTDGEGDYLFTHLAPGSYIVQVDPTSMPAGLAANPTFDLDGTGTPNVTVATVGTGEGNFAADFGYNWAPTTDVGGGSNTGAIGDQVWVDADGDGRQDPGEPGLGGVTVQLWYDSDNNGTIDAQYGANVTTAADGSYIFDNLPAGIYEVRITGGTTGYTPTGDPDQPGVLCTVCDAKTTAAIVLAPGDVYVNGDFGYKPTVSSSIGNLVFYDANGDGAYDADGPDNNAGTAADNEYGLADVTVALYADADNSGTLTAGDKIIATTRTDASGQYLFPGLPDGKYLVVINDTANVLSGMSHTLGTANTDNQSQALPYPVTLAGADVNTADFGYVATDNTPGVSGTGVIGDTIYLDTDNSGSQGASEPGLQGVLVRLFDSTGTTQLATTVTDANGNYYFAGLDATATYMVKVDTSTLPNGGTGMTNSGDPDGGTASESVVDLSVVGPINLAQDFGYHTTAPNTISGTIWTDTNADGVLSGEAGRFAGVTVVLRDSNGNIVATTVTDGNGDYSFTGLPDGTYTVDVTDTANVLNGLWKSTGPTPGGNDNSQSDPYSVTVTGGTENQTADFGYYGAPAAVGNFIWHDLNANGIQDIGEPGIPGVTVLLTITWPNTTTTVIQTVTDANGLYQFANLLLDENFDGNPLTELAAGEPTYKVSIPAMPGYLPSPQNGTTEDLDSDNPVGESASVTRGAVNNTYDFGLLLPNSLAGRVFADANNNGLFNGPDYSPDYGIFGVTITLTGTDDLGNPVNLITTTAADGTYSFNNLRPGTYTITESQPANFSDGKDTLGSTGGVLSNDKASTIVLIQDQNGTAYNFAEIGAGSIGDTVFLDLNSNGIADAGEGISGVTLTLTGDLNGDGVSTDTLTVVTDANGKYSFGNLPLNTSLTVKVTGGVASGLTQTFDPDGATMDASTVVTLTSGTPSVQTADFGYRGAGSIGDRIFADLNHSGFWEPGEGIAGVDVTIVGDMDGDGIPETVVVTTGVDGLYTLTGLRTTAGGVSYTVTVDTTDLPFGLTVNSVDPNNDNNSTSTVLLTDSNPTRLDQDFGYLGTGSIGNFVWVDSDGDGIQDGGEPGLNGVVVNLRRSSDNFVLATQTTSAAGAYLFTGLPPGSYYVEFIEPIGYDFTLLDEGGGKDQDKKDSDANRTTGKTATITLSNGEADLTVDAGVYQTVTIGNFAWVDTDGDGVQDGSELGLAGVKVDLYRPGYGPDGIPGTADDAAVVATMTTIAGGAYSFTGLPPGTYSVDFTLPSGAGYVFSKKDQGGDNALDSDVNPADGKTANFAVPSGQTNNTIDAGAYQPVSIGNFAWVDANGNGAQDGGELGLAGVKVDLYRPGFGPDGVAGNADDASVVKTMTTPAGGAYSFTGLPPGTYSVDFTLPSGYAFSPKDQGGDDVKDSDADLATGLTGLYTLTSGQSTDTVDAGAYQPVTIGNFVWVDANGNGVQDVGETGLAGAKVDLYRPGFGPDGVPGNGDDTAVVKTMNTPVGGAYSFTGLPPGTYTVDFTLPAGYVFSPKDLGGNDTLDSDADSGTGETGSYTLTSGQTNNTVDAGAYLPVSIGNFVWEDTNGNGLQDATELGLAGAKVDLYRPGFGPDGNPGTVGDNNDIVATMTTLAGGAYSFTGLPPGTYSVDFTLPAGYVFTPKDQGADDAKDSDANLATGETGLYPLTSGQTNNTVDAGAYQPVTIGNFVWDDTDGDGVQDFGELGIDGVTVELFRCGETVPMRTTTTAGGGLYRFDVPPGSYYVKFSPPAGYVFSAKDQGVDDTNDSDADPVTGKTACTTLSGGGVDMTLDAGLSKPSLTFTKSASKGNALPYEPIIYSYTVQNTGLTTLYDIVVTDDNGTPNYAGDDFTVGTIASLAPGASVILTATIIPVVSTVGIVNGTNVNAGSVIVVVPQANGDIKATYLQNFGINDNTYGTGVIGWPASKIHSFGDLTGSDKLEFRFFDKNGTNVLDFYVDTISAATSVTVPGAPVGSQVISYPSGYGTLGPLGGDGFMVSGNVSNIVTFSTSISSNLNNSLNVPNKAALIVNSPTSLVGGNVVVDPVKAPGGWDSINSYTVVVKASTFGAAGFGSVAVPDQHNSPNKLLGPNGMATTPTDSWVTNTASAIVGTVTNTATAKVFISDKLATLSNFVWRDDNANGVQDSGEPGVDGVTVELFTCVGDLLKGTTTTAGGGLYSFTVPPGDYYVKFSNLPASYVFSPSTASGVSDATDSDANPATGKTDCTTLVASEKDTTWDAGIYQPATIGDLVWEDTNGNGVQDGGELGKDGVTVELFTCVGDVLKGTTTTAGGGLYSFTTAPGSYYVKFSNLPVNYGFSPKNAAGTTAANDSDADPATGKTVCTTLVSGENDLTWDAGIFPAAKIGNFVWNDTDKDGIQDAGETGIDGVIVQLYTCLGDILKATTATASGGLYGFTVPPGDYYLKFSNLPAGFVFSPKNAVGTTDGNDSDANPADGKTRCITLQPGEDITWDAGAYNPNPAPKMELTKTANKSTAEPYEPVTYSYIVKNTGGTTLTGIVVKDDNGTPNYAGDDFTVGTIASLAPGASATNTATVIPVISTLGVVNGTNVNAGSIIVVVPQANGDIKATYLQDFGINDNTYGTGAIGWPASKIHTFGDLTGSDKLEFRFFDKNGGNVLDFYVDTISAATSVTVPGAPVGSQVISYPSGYGSLGPLGGDGFMVSGNVSNIVTFSTSISSNLNNSLNVPNKAALIVNSPTSLVGGNVVVDPAKAPGGWNSINSYTVVVKASTFGAAGFGSVVVPDQHNSPNKLLGPNGMATTPKNSMVTNTATATVGTLTNTATAVVSIVVPPPLPSPWQSQDIGNVGTALGSANKVGSVFTVAGSGADIGGTADAFRFVYQPASGDCTNVARVATQQNTSTGAKAGVMIRDNLTAGAMEASVSVTPGSGIVFSYRTATGGSTTKVAKTGSTLKAPYWVKLVRTGNVFTAFYSPTGSTWTALVTPTPVTIPMVAAPYIGLGVTSNKAGTLSTATFDNVTATP